VSQALRVVRHAHLDRLARLHALCFPDEAWDAVALAQVLAMPRANGRFIEDEKGHALGLVFDLLLAGEEVEILTLGVHPARRRQGIARALLAELFVRAAAAGAKRVLLEVAADNWAAFRLYEDLGFRTIGQRLGYYRRAAGPPVDARLLCRRLPD
jgi:ribosomal-protein-alanine N-acetyltransferase